MRSRLAGLRGRTPLLIIALLLLSATPASSQVEQPPAETTGSDALRVFLDCLASGCDADHFKREITFVNWVREPQDGQVHVIVTSEAAGAGRRYVMDFMGREDLEGLTDQYTHTSSVTDVSEEVRNALTQMLRLGLVRYAALAGFGSDLEVRGEAPTEGAGAAVNGPPSEDPWDFWVFSVSLSGSGFEEDQSSNRSLRTGLTANRTTDTWKLDFRGSGSFARSEYQLTDSTVYKDKRNTWQATGAAVRSLGDHWGVGTELEGSNSVSLNRDLLVGLGTGIEWDYFPYAESTRRSLLARWVVDFEHVEYHEATIFGKTTDLLVRQVGSVTYSAQEPWGRARVGVSANHILSEPDFYSVNFQGSLSYRIVRGLSISLGVGHSIINDQIYLSGAGLSDEERLLRRRQLETDSQTIWNLGLSYRFGSIFNNAVNTRFPSGVR